MRRLLLASLVFVAAGSTQAVAQNCSNANNAALNAAQIETLLAAGRYACGVVSGERRWNETLSGGASGTVTDYKQGPTHPRDPSRVVGNYTISNPQGFGNDGIISYTYNNNGGTYAYRVRSGSSQATTTPGTYSFCGVNGAQNWSILITNSPNCQ